MNGMSFAIRSAWREIRNNRSFSLFYCLNLALGLVGFLAVDSFKTSLETKVRSESRILLGADLAVRARRELTPDELDKFKGCLPPGTETTEVVDFYSMAAGPGNRSRLVRIIAFEKAFPFYGDFDLKMEGKVEGDAKENKLIHSRKLAWIYPELQGQLGLGLGEEIKVGETNFRVSDLVLRDSGLQFQPAELAPKVYLGKAFLAETNLLGQGNLAFHNHLLRLPEGTDEREVEAKLQQAMSAPEVRVYSHQRAGHRAGRLLGYLSDFLGLVSLVALFLASLGSGYLFHAFLTKRTMDAAILVSLGATRGKAIRVYLAQLFILGACAALIAIISTFLFLPLVSVAIRGIAPNDLEVFLGAKGILLAFCVATLTGWLIALPSLRKLYRLRPADLFREAAHPGSHGKVRELLFFLPAGLAFWGLTLLQSDSSKLGNLFVVSFLVSSAILYGLAILALKGLGRAFGKSRLSLRLAARSLERNRSSSVTAFLALGMGVLLLTLIPQFQHSLENEIGLNQPESKLPKLFLFNLREDQVDKLVSLLEETGKPLANLTPRIRGKLLRVKGEEYKKVAGSDRDSADPDDQRRNNFRNRGFNLSYRDRLLESEEIIRGRMVRRDYDRETSPIAEISVEQRYAESLGLDLGDRIEIEVGGVPIEAKVVNVRRVRWTSFQPNFFVQMQPGVLDEAPKTFIGTLNDLNASEKQDVQDLLVREFPSISIIDVERTGQAILSIVRQMTWALQVMAGLSVLAGLVILFSVSREKVHRQRWEINLQKVLGARFSNLRNQVRIEFGILGLAASLTGISLSTLVSRIFSEYVFDRVWSFNWVLPVATCLTVAALSILTAEFATRKLLRMKPVDLLRER